MKLSLAMILLCSSMLLRASQAPTIIQVHASKVSPYSYCWDASQTGKSVKPGTIFQFDSGSLIGSFKFVNIHGTADSPIIIRNIPGHKTSITTTNPYCLWLSTCTFVKLVGDDVSHFILSAPSFGAIGLKAGEFFSDIEISHVQVNTTGGEGMLIKNDPSCTTNITTFSSANTIIHDCLVQNTGREGLYVGNTKFWGQQFICNGDTIYPIPPLMYNTQVYNNTVLYSGWTGIQISSAPHTNCYNNTVMYDSRTRTYAHMCGMRVGGASSGLWRNNTVKYGFGNGIECFGEDTVTLSNFYVLIKDTVAPQYAVYINDDDCLRPSVFIVDSFSGSVTRTQPIMSVNRPNVSKTVQFANTVIYSKN